MFLGAIFADKFQNSEACLNEPLQAIENRTSSNGPAIAITRVPVMYRLLGNFPARPRTAGFDKSNRQSSGPQKGTTGRITCSRHDGNNHRPHSLWEASDQRRTAKRHSGGSGVFCIGTFLDYKRDRNWINFPGSERLRKQKSRNLVRKELPSKSTCQPEHLAVVSDLPIKRLTRATPF